MRKLYPVSVSCEVLEVSASGYFNWLRRRESGHGGPARRHSDEALLAHIRAIHAEVKGEYGWPRMHKELLARGIRVGKRGAAVFLRANSRHRLDDGRSADIEMRRAGTRVATDAGSGRPLSLAERNLDLAKRIEAFVARLPEPLTARQALQRQLRAKAEAGRTVQHDGQSQQPKTQGIPNEKDKGRSR